LTKTTKTFIGKRKVSSMNGARKTECPGGEE
jgi:hypothetical protein